MHKRVDISVRENAWTEEIEMEEKHVGMGTKDRHLRKMDCSLAIVGGPSAAYSHGTASRGRSIHWPSI